MTQTPIKILHTADCHLDSPLLSLALRDAALRDRVQAATRAGFTRIVDVALDEAVAALLIAGDLFDGAERSARTAAFLTAQLDRLHAAGIAVFYIKGNHDAENPITGEVSLPDNVHVFDGRGGKVQLGGHDIWIHGVSFSGRHAPESLLGKFGAPVDGAVNIAMLHTSLAGAAGHDPYAPCSVTELAGMGFDYWALGHVHKRQVHAHRPWIVMPGMPQGRDIGEAGTKSATLLRIDGAAIGIEEIPTSAIEFLDLAVDATGMDDDAALRARLREDLRGVSRDLPSQAAIVRLTVTGPTARRWQYLRDRDMWRETADALAADTGRIWVEKLDFDLRDPAGHDDGNAAASTDELAHLMQAIRREPAFTAELQAELDTLLAELPPQRRAKLIPDEAAATALGQALASSGAARLLALMKAAAG
ncbi:metallophosphoesterase family protein [Sulfitobacter sabulilitoris]|uniref:DNA repair exonuclease n=1 Tax=Sulfitobacter sabulilitoris TaxID=2562655 RepID=A0A5S3PI94_9RHOB|nr:DNA repair exonuclease [Sulfitobacter sabulilitoris]TMM54036.1 DNA repair exonuclease [Sulfitobacter sabulilitoris]